MSLSTLWKPTQDCVIILTEVPDSAQTDAHALTHNATKKTEDTAMAYYWLGLCFHILLEIQEWSWASYKYEPSAEPPTPPPQGGSVVT